MIRRIKILMFCFCCLFSQIVQASDLSLYIAEAFGFGGMKYASDSFELGYNTSVGLQVGARYINAGSYLGIGTGVNDSLNFYGLLGQRFSMLASTFMDLEFIGYGNFYSKSRAIFQCGIGVVF